MADNTPMTPEQISVARHALGLPNKHRLSYRNHFCAGPGHTDYETWQAMVEAGEATRRDGKRLPYGGDDLFHLTRKGAEAALTRGEKLDPKDFPAIYHDMRTDP